MERHLILVEPDGPDWQVRLDDQAVIRHVGRVAAIHRATEMARDRHRVIGIPTGVRVRMRCGDKVMIAANG